MKIIKTKEIELISVAEVALLFGIQKFRQSELKDKKIIVINKRKHRIVGAFQLIDSPIPLDVKCSTCCGTGKMQVKIPKL